jgi:hypothetical protein
MRSGHIPLPMVASTAPIDCMETKSSMHGWVRPYGNVPATAAGAQHCITQCKNGGFEFAGLECPGAHGVHCQCGSKAESHYSLAQAYCSDGLALVHAHAHCTGPFKKEGYMFGDYNVGSVYKSGHVPPPLVPSGAAVDCMETKSSMHGWTRPYGNVPATAAGAQHCITQCKNGGYKFAGTRPAMCRQARLPVGGRC